LLQPLQDADQKPPEAGQLHFLQRHNPLTDTPEVKILMDFFFDLSFSSSQEITETVNGLFLPLDIKLIPKTKERYFSNGYYLFILYCSKVRQKEYVPSGSRQYRKRENECKFNLSFSRWGVESYRLSGGNFVHNHEMTCDDIHPQ
jgi:hypothetical protein